MDGKNIVKINKADNLLRTEKYYEEHLQTRVANLNIRTVAAIMMWSVVALLLLNQSVRSEGIWVASIFIMIIAVIIYFSSRLKKLVLKSKDNLARGTV